MSQPSIIPDGPVFRINTHTSGQQRLSQATALSDGNFYVTWTSTDQDGDRYGVYGQLFDADGNPIGTETQINTYTSSDQTLPQVTAYGDGEFVVVWQSFAQDETVYDSYPDGLSPTGYRLSDYAYVYQYGIFAQRFNSAGQPIGNEFQVNTTTRDNQSNAEIISLPDGGFVIVWGNTFAHITYFDEPYGSSRFQRYDADGNPVGGEVTLDTYAPAGDIYHSLAGANPSFTVTADGILVATWNTIYSTDTIFTFQPQMRTFDLDGTPLTNIEFVTPPSSRGLWNSSITGLDDGGYVIVLMQDVSGLSTSREAVYARVFDAKNNPIGDEFRVSDGEFEASHTRVVALDNGGFVVAWGGNAFGLFAQEYSRTGQEVGPELRLSWTPGEGYDFDIAALENGHILVTSTRVDTTLDPSTNPHGEVFGQIFETSTTGHTLVGNDDNDWISGSNGNDIIDGNLGDDHLTGGDGANTLTGGLGADEFIFNTLTATDTVTDFEAGIDIINLHDQLVQAESVSFNLNGMSYNSMNCFSDLDVNNISVSLVQNGNNTEVYLNYTGANSSLPDADPLVILEGIDATTLSFDDFIL